MYKLLFLVFRMIVNTCTCTSGTSIFRTPLGPMQAKCPDYRGVLISEVKVKCHVFIQIKALQSLITLLFIKTYERMTKSYKLIKINIHKCMFVKTTSTFHFHFSNSVNCYTYAIGFRTISRKL